MILHKITSGFVVQKFDTNLNAFVEQSFVAGDSTYETPEGDVEVGEQDVQELFGQGEDEVYLPFAMQQPGYQEQLNTVLAALRFYQHSGMCEPANRPDWLQAIACPTEDDTSLDSVGVDRLCEQFNTI